MATTKEEPLFLLIKSMSKSEKRHFKLFVNRSGHAEDLIFIGLFDVLDKQSEFDEELVLAKVKGLKKVQLSNMKAHLYKQLLTSLRLNHLQNNIDIQLRESLDYARVLYNKGLYKQSLKLLDKSKAMAIGAEKNIICLEIIEFEKLIESQYITRSMGDRAKQLTGQSTNYTKVIATTNAFSNLTLKLYSLYLKVGFVRNEKEYLFARSFFESNLPPYAEETMTFHELLYLYQSKVWYYFIIQDFVMCYRYAQKWHHLFTQNPETITSEPVLYLKSVHNLLGALYNLQHFERFCEVLDELEQFANQKELKADQNREFLVFLYIYSNRINKHFMEGTFSEGVRVIPELLVKIDEYKLMLDPHRIMTFYYKIASMYFGSGDNKNAIVYLQKVINFKDVTLRTDIHCFARILNLIAHYDEGLDHHLEYQIKSVYHFLGKMDDLQAVQKEIFDFLKKLNRMDLGDLKREFIKLRNRLAALTQHPYERRPFLYLDIISWLESKIYNRPVQQIIKEKRRLGVATLNEVF